MPIYQPASFLAAANVGRELTADFPFATLITAQPDGSPWISHLPLLADPTDPDCLLGHLAAANGHASALLAAPSVAVFHGEHGYISPRHYASSGQVPTWNYRVAHAHGQGERLDDEALRTVLYRLSAAFEGESGWSPDEMPPAALAAMQRGIVGFRLRVTHWEVKEKLSQNRSAADRDAVTAALAAGDGAQAALAARMRAAARQSG